MPPLGSNHAMSPHSDNPEHEYLTGRTQFINTQHDCPRGHTTWWTAHEPCPTCKAAV